MKIVKVITIFLSACFFGYGQRFSGPSDCAVHDQLPAWSVRILNAKTIRIAIDSSGVTHCVEYYDIEFVVELLASNGDRIATRRLAAPGLSLSGPGAFTLDYALDSANSVKLKGVSMNCKKRTYGVLPGDDLDADLGQAREAAFTLRRFQEEAQNYSDWDSQVHDDYYETVGPRGIVCPAGSLMSDASLRNDACEKAREAAAAAVAERLKRYGDAQPPIAPWKAY